MTKNHEYESVEQVRQRNPNATIYDVVTGLKTHIAHISKNKLIFKKARMARYYFKEFWLEGIVCAEVEADKRGKLGKRKRSFEA